MNDRTRGLGTTCLVLLAVGGTLSSAEEPAKIPDVTVTRPVVREVTDYEDFTGRTEASVRVELRPRVTGYLTKASFKEGDGVKEGTVLFEIDPRPYQALLDQALGQVEVSKAALKLARATLARDQAAAKAVPGSVSQQQLDRDEAAVEEAQAQVAVSEAATTLHKLNLSFCKVTAPVSGQIGRCQADPGNLVRADETALATIVAPSPMYVYFDIDERTVVRLRRRAKADKVEFDKLPVAVGLADEEGFSHHGVLSFTNSEINPDAGTLRVRTALANKDKVLVPGMFVRVRVALSAPYKALLVSDRAVASDQGLKFVYVVDAENKVQYRRVTIGQLQPDGLRVITKGLEPDDRVVTGRLTGLRPGMTVKPQEPPPAPKPSEKPEAPPSVRGQAGRGVLVEATYPGAGAQVVSDSVRSPIEQQVSGLEKVRYMRSRCTQDGKYALDIAFVPGTDLGQAQVLVQNRASLASPLLPTAVQEAGITVGAGTSGVLLIVNLVAPQGGHDRMYLGNYANIRLKDELAHMRGVGKVALLGGSDFGLRVEIDPDRLAARNLNTEDVARVLRKENRHDRASLEKLPDLIVKIDGEGRAVRLRDVARVDFITGRLLGGALRDGKPVAALVVHLTGEIAPRKVRAALRERLDELRPRLPEGLDFDVTFDFTANLDTFERSGPSEYLLFDLDVQAASAEGTEPVLERAEALLRQVPGVQSVLALSANPFDLFGGRPCLLARLSPADVRKGTRGEITKTARTRLGALEEVTVRVRDLSAAGCFPRCGYPIDLVLNGPDLAEVRTWADRLAERLGESKTFTDVWANPDSVPRPVRTVDVNRELAAARGVALADIFSTIDAYSGAVPVSHFNSFGRTWPVEIQTRARPGDWAAGLGKLKVRNAKGVMVPLTSVVTVRDVEAPLALDFFELQPMVEITANPEPGVSVGAAQKACAALADEVRKELGLTAEYRLTWLPLGVGGK